MVNWLFEAGGGFGWVPAGAVGTSREHLWCSVGWSRAVTRAQGTSALHWWGPGVVSAPTGAARTSVMTLVQADVLGIRSASGAKTTLPPPGILFQDLHYNR